MKISVTISFADLVTNSCLPLFLCLLRNQNKNQNVSNFVYSESCSTSKQCRIQQTFRKEFSYLMFLFVLQFYDKRERFAYSDTFLDFSGTKNKHAIYSTSSSILCNYFDFVIIFDCNYFSTVMCHSFGDVSCGFTDIVIIATFHQHIQHGKIDHVYRKTLFCL